MPARDRKRKNEIQRRYVQRHPERQRKFWNNWYHNNKEKEAVRSLKKAQKDREQYMLVRTRAKAKKEGREFNLERSDIVIPEICPILLTPLVFGTKRKWNQSPSIDRIDNSKGYVKGNIRVISARANTMKSNMDIPIVERMLAYMKGEL